MKAIEIFEKHYPKLTKSIEKHFPDFLKTAEEVAVIPWQEEFQIADKNPEVIEEVEFWNTLLDSGVISEGEWRTKTNQALRKSGYASKTMGISFMETKEVSFRQKVPDQAVLVHEVGHVHFQEIDAFWSSTYGGGEILFWLGLKEKYSVKEENVRRFMSLFRKAHDAGHLEVAEEIVEKIGPLFGEQIVPHFYTICLFSGWLPDGVGKLEIDTFDLKNEKWLDVEPERYDVVMFFPNLTSGLQFADPFWVQFARALEVIR